MHIFKKSTRAILILVILLGLAGGVIWVVQSTGPKFSTIPNPSKAEIVVSPEIVSIQSEARSATVSSSTTLPDSELMPVSESSDSKIVFVDNLGGIRDLYIVNPDGTELMNLTEGLGVKFLENKPRWAADGSRIYFSLEGTVQDNQDISLYTIKPDGSDATKLFDWPHQIRAYDVSSDGQWIAYTANTLSTNGNPMCAIFKIRIDGTELTRLTDEIEGEDAPRRNQCDSPPVWSPDGSLILFASNRRNPNSELDKVNLYTIRFDGSELTQLTDRDWDIFTARWSPDGTRIAIGAKEGDSAGNLYLMNADGSNLHQVTNSITPGALWYQIDYGKISWSPDGTQLVVQKSTENGLGIVDLITGQETYPLIPGADMSDASQPDWSPFLGEAPTPTPTATATLTPTATATLTPTATPSGQVPSNDIGDYVVLGLNSVWLRQGSDVYSGHVGA